MKERDYWPRGGNPNAALTPEASHLITPDTTVLSNELSI